jgi:hypothetical protein
MAVAGAPMSRSSFESSLQISKNYRIDSNEILIQVIIVILKDIPIVKIAYLRNILISFNVYQPNEKVNAFNIFLSFYFHCILMFVFKKVLINVMQKVSR